MRRDDAIRIRHMIEAASKVSLETRSSVPTIPWPIIVSMRNRLIHAYFDVDPDILWVTVTEEIPPLLGLLRACSLEN